ncbi:MAG: UDP-N-acetylmuramate dehydrogenase [Eubacteriales bacterium]|jgi:UDP-N-acetylmuramate dehydrogenase|nr:UDP-N-acetylmuramate dehydrogenase [Eubacteriales bacterium]
MYKYKLLDELLGKDGRYSFKRDGLLSECCTFKIGGAADYIIYPNSADALIKLITVLCDNEIRHTVFGNGSNVLFPDDGYRGVVVFTRYLNDIVIKNDLLCVHSGTLLTLAAVSAFKAGLKGIEFAYGIPGSCGGAVYMNAGAFGGQMSDIVIAGSYYDPAERKIVEINDKDHHFGYRRSLFTGTDLIIITSSFKLQQDDPASIKERMDINMRHRVKNQPLEYPSAGSIFKRYPGYYTSKLIEEAGLKGKQIGRAQVSTKHAGFIVNLGGATASDVLCLINIIKETVYKKYSINIECEIKLI